MIDYQKIANICVSKNDFAKKLGYGFYNGKIAYKIQEIIDVNLIETKHFSKCGGHNKKYNLSSKVCPVCNKTFLTKIGSRSEKKTCSYSCSNKFHKRIKDEDLKSYTTKCFRFHKKRCVICGEENIVGVHHFDENHENDEPENLVPMCPTHHQYWHSKFKHIVYEKVSNYVKDFLNKK